MNNENKIKYDSSVGKLLENIKVDYTKFMSNTDMVESFKEFMLGLVENLIKLLLVLLFGDSSLKQMEY